MISNSASWGGVVLADGDSTVTATTCTMPLNSAWWGGAVLAIGESTVTTTVCMLTLTSASLGGGAICADGDSTVISTDCTMAANTAAYGGAVAVSGDAIVSVTECMMASNSAFYYGGAVHAVDDSTVTATDCTMVSNSASWGGAVAVGDNTTLTAATATIEQCSLTSNAAASNAAALVVRKSGIADLVNSVFRSNNVGDGADDGVGIVNLNGQVRCSMIGCLSICTVCRDEDDEPTPQPAVQNHKRKTPETESTSFIIGGILFMFGLLGSLTVARRCRNSSHGGHRSGDGQQQSDDEGQYRYSMINLRHDANLDTDDEHNERSQLDSQINWPLLENASAPILIVDHGMRIKSWSSGKIVSSPPQRLFGRRFDCLLLACCRAHRHVATKCAHRRAGRGCTRRRFAVRNPACSGPDL